MTIQEVLSIKEEKSQQTKKMTVSELKDYYAKCMREFSIVMDDLVAAAPREIENFECAEEKVEYTVKNNTV